MDRIPLTSSTIESVGYDSSSRTLEIEFKGGSVYQYFEVPEQVFTALRAAASPGSFFDSTVKKAGYQFKRID